MAKVPEYDEFEALQREVHAQREELEFLRSLLLSEVWLDRQQTMTALDCSADTLRRLHLAGELEFRYQGDRPFYCIYSVRNYLTAKKIEKPAVDRRILSAVLAKKQEKIRPEPKVRAGSLQTHNL